MSVYDLSADRAARVELARSVLSFARNASDEGLAAACRTLRRDGDPVDYDKAVSTLKSLGRDDVLPPSGFQPGET
ncbi:hypothetical protein FHY55_19350 [Oceanicola sp. D3]|uniref:hypothetical protein n=1 Tax=Oceanicola sp. D3 TaxID=2587163 RepID=UPI00111D65C6|nr:hypothetical protein [Oceanicola sp. D3]QDC11255.1 hypothetical protein FHY55_19350 [Oceanicola sp. D3]